MNTDGIASMAADPALATTLDLSVTTGRFLDAAVGRYPVVVLGRERLAATTPTRATRAR